MDLTWEIYKTDRLTVNQKDDQEKRQLQSKHDIKIEMLKNDITTVLDALTIQDSVSKIKRKYKYSEPKNSFKMSYIEEPKSISSRDPPSEKEYENIVNDSKLGKYLDSEMMGPDLRGNPKPTKVEVVSPWVNPSNHPGLEGQKVPTPGTLGLGHFGQSNSHASLHNIESNKPYVENSGGLTELVGRGLVWGLHQLRNKQYTKMFIFYGTRRLNLYLLLKVLWMS